MKQAVVNKLRQVELMLLDVDGVLTDGTIIYSDDGIETKVFHVRDGLGIRLLMNAGVQVGIVTGRAGRALKHRCENLGIHLVFDGVRDKAAVLPSISRETGIAPENTAFVGDDFPDIPLLKRVGVAIAVNDAHELVRGQADMVTEEKGGKGAVREICEAILKAKGLWDAACNNFL